MSFNNKAFTLGAALVALLVSTAGAFAATAYATNPVNVRSGPGTSHAILDTLRRGERVEVEYCRGSWCAVSKSGPDGWVSANYLSRDGYYDDDDYYDDDYYYDRPRVIRRLPRHFDRDFRACIGGPNARFCVYD